MTIIDLGTVKIRFDPNDIRVSIDGNNIDIGARIQQQEEVVIPEISDDPTTQWFKPSHWLYLSELNRKINELDIEELRNTKPFLKPVIKKELDKLEKKIRKKTKYRPE